MGHRTRNNTLRGRLGRAIGEGANAFAQVPLLIAQRKQNEAEEKRRQETHQVNQLRISQENEAREFRLEDLRKERQLSVLSGDPVDKLLAQRQIDLESPGVDRRQAKIFESLVQKNVPSLAGQPIPRRLMNSREFQDQLTKRLFTEEETPDLLTTMRDRFLRNELSEKEITNFLTASGRDLSEALPAQGIPTGVPEDFTDSERFVRGLMTRKEDQNFRALQATGKVGNEALGFAKADRQPEFDSPSYNNALRTLIAQSQNLRRDSENDETESEFRQRQDNMLTSESVVSLARNIFAQKTGAIDDRVADTSRSFGLEQQGGGGSPADTPLTPDPDPIEIQGVSASESKIAQDLVLHSRDFPDETINWDAVLASDSTLRLKVLQSLVLKGLKNNGQ